MTKSRLRLTPLEDRCTPASFVGNVITLDDGGEVLTIFTDTNGQYTLTSSVDVNESFDPVVFTPEGPVSIVDAVGSASVLFANSTAAYAHDFTVVLNDGSLGVRFDGATDFGDKSLSVTVDRDIAVNPKALVTSTIGNLGFSANMQAAARIGEFIGVDVQGQVASTGSGTVSVSGRGGLLNSTFGLFGVQVIGATASIMTVEGKLTVTGTGGGGTGDANIGVHLAGGAKITSGARSELNVSGTGGAGAGQGNYGVLVQNAGSSIDSDGGDVIVLGTAGTHGKKSYGVGVYVNDGGRITAGLGRNIGQQIFLTGIGGGTDSSEHNNGVFVVGQGSNVTSGNGAITLQGTGGGGSGGGSIGVHFAEGATLSANNTVTMTGTGGSGTGSYNLGVMVQGKGTTISFSDNLSKVDGTAGASGSSYGVGVMVYNGAKITSTANASVSVKGTGRGGANSFGVHVLGNGAEISSVNNVGLEGVAPTNGMFATDGVFIAGGGKISGGATGQVSIQADAFGAEGVDRVIAQRVSLSPRTDNFSIDLGGVSDYKSGQPTLELTNIDLAAITADVIGISASGLGEIRITNPVAARQFQSVSLITRGAIISDYNTTLDVGTASLTLIADQSVQPAASIRTYMTFVADSIQIVPFYNNSDRRLSLRLQGILDDQYAHLDLSGSMNIDNIRLILDGSYVPKPGDVFTLVSAGSLTGTFANTPDNTLIPFNGVNLRINYTATSVTATVV